jgi:hypothetical protein
MSRQAVEEELYKILDEITFDTGNSTRYREAFKTMDTAQFMSFFRDIKAGKRKLPIFIPPHGKAKMDFATVVKVGERMGLQFYGKIIEEVDGNKFTSFHEALILKTHVRRLAQTLDAKISVADGDSKIDAMSGQVTSGAKAASISAVELSVLVDNGLTKTSAELATVRGGDSGAYAYLKAATSNTGGASLNVAMEYRTGVGSKRAIKMLLMAKHIGTNL